MVEFVLGSKSKVTINTFFFFPLDIFKNTHTINCGLICLGKYTRNIPDRSKNKKQTEAVN